MPPRKQRQRLAGLNALFVTANVGAWLWAWLVFSGRPALLGLALLAGFLEIGLFCSYAQRRSWSSAGRTTAPRGVLPHLAASSFRCRYRS